jgi:hypothetical protein
MDSAGEVVLLMGKLCEKFTFHSSTSSYYLPAMFLFLRVPKGSREWG